ncbi:MAG: Peptidoglycan-N-acetylmuramic acid deacetylase PdaC [Firmicutes bacterium ADurb.Bin193]|nr:MAG: Peptidoglycan-N-acetylmuramic acid deacetylase PdaC [Firmicutes bacterium ADurb.Bin193]
MNNFDIKAEISTLKVNRSFKHNNVVMLNIDIEYPSIILEHGSAIQTRINLHYKNYAKNYYRYAAATLLPNAIEQYKASVENGFPFNAYEAVMKYTVTLNDKCTLSTFFDKYEYTGGAHGNTIRTSDNWNLQTGQRIRMAALFGNNTDYRKIIIRKIQAMAEEDMESTPGIYFDDYKKLIAENFSTQNFNLTENTLNVYYQQYEIAPYASGIIVFSIPYGELGIKEPSCIRTV